MVWRASTHQLSAQYTAEPICIPSLADKYTAAKRLQHQHFNWKHTSMLNVRADREGEFGDPGSVQDLMSAPVTKLMSRTELPDGPACKNLYDCMLTMGAISTKAKCRAGAGACQPFTNTDGMERVLHTNDEASSQQCDHDAGAPTAENYKDCQQTVKRTPMLVILCCQEQQHLS
jgi:hypothetical protein